MDPANIPTSSSALVPYASAPSLPSPEQAKIICMKAAAKGLLQWCEVMKAEAQRNPSINGTAQVASTVYKNKGLAGFQAGALATAAKDGLKSLYRAPMVAVIRPNVDFYTQGLTYGKQIREVATGTALATVETLFVVTMLENVKLWMITAEKGRGYYDVVTTRIKENGFKELYRGVGSTWLSQMSRWVPWMASNQILVDAVKSSGIKESSPLLSEAVVDLGTAGLMTLFLMPPDYVKTHIQTDKGAHRKMLDVFVETLKKHGPRRFYVGWGWQVFRMSIDTAFARRLVGAPDDEKE